MNEQGYSGKALIVSQNDMINERTDAEQIGKMTDLAKQLVAPAFGMNEQDSKFNELMVLGIYKQRMEHCKTIPEFEDVYESIASYNDDIFAQMALTEFEGRYDEFQITSDDERDDILTELEDCWRDMYYYNYTYGPGLDYYVQEILDKNRMSYIFDSRDVVYSESRATSLVRRMPRIIEFVNNDSQNLLMPEMLIYGFTGYGDYINYNTEYAESQLMLTVGESEKGKK